MKKILPLLILVASSFITKAQTTFSLITVPCNNDGILQASFGSGTLTPPLTVTWQTMGTTGTAIVHTGVSGLSDVLTSYSGGPLTIVATDASGNTDTGSYGGRPPFILCPLTVNGAPCPAPDTLGASICFGGMPPFRYTWYNTGTSGIVGTLNPMPVTAGNTYGVTITDAAGCTYGSLVDPLQAFAYVLPSFSDSVTTTVAGCNNGTASVFATGGGTAPFTYLWSNGATTASIGGLVMGLYHVTVTDVNGCYASAYGYVNQTITITAPVIPTPSLCTASTGAVIAFGAGGTPPYSYVWSNGATTQSQTGLPGGTYTVNVTDANGCIGSDVGFVGVTTPISVTYTTTPSLCTSATGTATLSISGGTAPYTTTWYTAPPQTGYTAAALISGTYSFDVHDAAGCGQTGSVYVPPVDVVSASFLSVPAVCIAANGSMTAYPTGGVAPYHYLWSTGATTATISSRPAGNYSVKITDNLGCSITKYPYLPSTSPVTIGAISTPATCVYASDGTNTALALGGTPPYSYGWSSGGTTSTISALPYGPYWVFATDAAGCTTPPYYSYVGYNASASSCYCSIEGTVYHDINGNCTQDAGEPGIPNIQIHIAGGPLGNAYTYTDASGFYSYKVPSGSYTVSQTVLAYYPLSSCQVNNIAVTSVAGTGCINTINFADSMDTVHDMHISTWDYYHPHDPTGTAITGHTYTAATIIVNEGSVPEDSVMATYKTDGQLFSPAFIPGGFFAGSPYFYTTNTVPSVAPGGSTMFLENYTVPTNIPMGTSVIIKDTVSYKGPTSNWLTDYSPWNNVNYFTTITAASFDPNFKEVSPKGTGPAGIIQYTDSILEYMVHFQNTGNWMAENIYVLDTLDDNLDWTTLRPTFASAQCKTDLMQSGTKKVARFTFSNINLPPQSTDEMRSNGMFTYTIHIKPSLPVGTQFRNHASIYFDYNAPVVTNSTLNTLGSAGPGVGVKNINPVNYSSFNIYPNPANQTFNAIITSQTAATAEMKISDITGRLMATRTITLQTGMQTVPVDVSQLAPGTYFVTLHNNGTIQTQKLVILK
jgi:uncharacterized repeat protein (TIGR01451 family)